MAMKPVGSVITTAQKEVSLYELNQLTERGAEIQLSSDKKARAVARLVEVGNPSTVDKNLVSSLESITTYPVIENSRTTFPKDGQVKITVTGYAIRIDDIETADKCLEAIELSLAPLTSEQINEQLKMLATLVVKPAGETADDVSLRIKSMSDQLMQFPADIVLQAIGEVTKRTTFWPAYAEFYSHIGWRVHKRNKLKESVLHKKVALMLKNQ